MEIIAIGTLIGAKIAAAGAAVATTAAAHPILFSLGAATALAGAATGIVGGVQSHQAGKSAAQQAELQMQAERTQAAIEETERQRRLRRVLGMQSAMFGEAGIDLSSGTPVTLAEDSYAMAREQGQQAGVFSGTRLALLGMQQADSLASGNAGMTRGFLSAGASLMNFGTGMASIGSTPGSVSKTFAPNAGPASGGLA